MAAVRTNEATLVGALWPSSINAALRTAALVAAGIIVLTISAKVKVPFFPVPVTLQTLAVPLIAAAYGARLGTATVIAYLAAGFLGLPVFTNTPPAVAGPLYFLGTTGGYLAAYPLAAVIVGTVAESKRGRSGLRLFGAMLLADIVVLTAGFVWLAFVARLDSGAIGLGVERAWAGGIAPFLLADLVKTALAAALIRAGWSFAEGLSRR